MYRQFSKCYYEETANGVACLSQNGWWDFRKSGPDSPVSLFKHACEGAESSISRNQNRFAVRDGLRTHNKTIVVFVFVRTNLGLYGLATAAINRACWGYSTHLVYILVHCSDGCRLSAGILSPLRSASRTFSRREGNFFVCFLPYRTRLPRPNPLRVCPVACSRARTVGVGENTG